MTDSRHCPGCRGFGPGWEHECAGLPVPAVPPDAKLVIEQAVADYATQCETGPPTGQQWQELPDMITGALAGAGLLAAPGDWLHPGGRIAEWMRASGMFGPPRPGMFGSPRQPGRQQGTGDST